MKFLNHTAARLFLCAGLLLLAGCTTMDLPAFKWGRDDTPAATTERQASVPVAATPSGKRAYCMVSKGAARFGRGWYDFAEAKFTVQDGQRVNVPLARKGGSGKMQFQSVLDTAGQKMVFCPFKEGPPDQRVMCASIYALEDDLNMGIRRTFDIPDAVRGGVISCAYDRKNLVTF